MEHPDEFGPAEGAGERCMQRFHIPDTQKSNFYAALREMRKIVADAPAAAASSSSSSLSVAAAATPSPEDGASLYKQSCKWCAEQYLADRNEAERNDTTQARGTIKISNEAGFGFGSHHLLPFRDQPLSPTARPGTGQGCQLRFALEAPPLSHYVSRAARRAGQGCHLRFALGATPHPSPSPVIHFCRRWSDSDEPAAAAEPAVEAAAATERTPPTEGENEAAESGGRGAETGAWVGAGSG